MVWTAVQTRAFWSGANQLNIPANVVTSIANDGITDIDSLEDFYEENLRLIQKRAIQDDTLDHFGELLFMRLATACHVVRYYKTIGREIEPSMMQWQSTSKNFHHGLKAKQALTDKTPPDIPQISRAMPVMKWAPAFEIVMESTDETGDFLPLMYVIRKNEDPADPAPALLANKPYSQEHGSL